MSNDINTPIENIFSQRFGRYSKYIIQERALPDVRDGLKPVQRRILYAMHQDNNTFDKQFRKSAKTVGNVIGNYHPHGDSSVYEAMVRMSQTWKINEQLVVMHGNNGSVDGDNPAAMRYTEAKLSEYSNFMLKDINKETVKMQPNFDDTEFEPSVLPTKVPNLLVNGTSGIASGYATEIPPHNMKEVLKAAIALNKDENLTLDQIMKYIKAPDFPTGGIIQGIDQIKKAYETGRGKIVLRAKYEIKGNDILISEIPYEVNKAVLLQKIELLKINGKIQGLDQIIDQSDQHGLDIKISCLKSSSPQMIINFLLKQTDLQKNYNFNMIAIANKKPKLMGIKEILSSFLAHREDVINKRSNFELAKAKSRLEIVEGFMTVNSHLDEVIATIRSSQDRKDAKINLVKKFKFSDNQVEAILSMQLYRLTNTDIIKLEEEFKELTATISKLNNILKNRNVLKDVIDMELNEVLKTSKVKRKSIIKNEIEDIVVNKADLIKEEKNILLITENKYIKRTNLRSYLAAKGKIKILPGDKIQNVQPILNKDKIVIFFNDGTYALVNAYDIEETKWKELGKNLTGYIKDIEENSIVDMKVLPKDGFVVTASKKGYIAKIKVEDFLVKKLNKKIKFQKLVVDDEVISIDVVQNNQEVIMLTDTDKFQTINVDTLEETSIKRQGKKFKTLNKRETLIVVRKFNKNIICFSKEGYYIYFENKNLGFENYKFELMFKNLKTNKQNIDYFITDIEDEFVLITNEEMLNIKINDIKTMNVGDRIKTFDVTGEIEAISKYLL